MKVLIFGASGFIGFPVAQALLRAGHVVYGQTRSVVKAKKLATEEIIPIVGEVSDPSPWISLIGTLDAVVEALAGKDMKDQSIALLNAVADAVQKYRPSHAPKITYLYTSGIWAHGDNRHEIVSDTTALVSPIPFVQWRPALEQTILSSTVVNGVVIRPSLVFGRSGSIISIMFESAYNGRVTWFGKPGGRIPLIHQDDMADLYVRVLEHGLLLRGQAFDASNNFTENLDDIMARLTEASGAKQLYQYVEPSNPFEEAIASTAIARPYLGRGLLGWQPRKPGLADNIQIYYDAWKANAGLWESQQSKPALHEKTGTTIYKNFGII